MTLDEVIDRVNQISRLAGDPEAAHSKEDDLYEDVLKHVAWANHECSALAAAALKTKDIDFERWCA